LGERSLPVLVGGPAPAGARKLPPTPQGDANGGRHAPLPRLCGSSVVPRSGTTPHTSCGSRAFGLGAELPARAGYYWRVTIRFCSGSSALCPGRWTRDIPLNKNSTPSTSDDARALSARPSRKSSLSVGSVIPFSKRRRRESGIPASAASSPSLRCLWTRQAPQRFTESPLT
jgi:hypothetical protein